MSTMITMTTSVPIPIYIELLPFVASGEASPNCPPQTTPNPDPPHPVRGGRAHRMPERYQLLGIGPPAHAAGCRVGPPPAGGVRVVYCALPLRQGLRSVAHRPHLVQWQELKAAPCGGMNRPYRAPAAAREHIWRKTPGFTPVLPVLPRPLAPYVGGSVHHMRRAAGRPPRGRPRQNSPATPFTRTPAARQHNGKTRLSARNDRIYGSRIRGETGGRERAAVPPGAHSTPGRVPARPVVCGAGHGKPRGQAKQMPSAPARIP